VHKITEAPRKRPPQATGSYSRMKLLRDAWLANVLKRAIAEVSQASAEDYQVFGLDRDDLLAQLKVLRADTQNATGSRVAQLCTPIGKRGRKVTYSADLQLVVVG